MTIEAMKQALEALGKCRYRSLADEIVDPAITALRTAIEQAEKQEPVAFNRKAVWNVLFEVWNQNISASEGLQKLQDLYTTPPAQPAPVQEPDCDRSACGDFSPGPCDNPSCPALRTTPPAAQPAPVQEPKHIVQSNGRHSPLLTHMMNSRNTPPAAQPCPHIRSTAEGTHHCALANQTKEQA